MDNSRGFLQLQSLIDMCEEVHVPVIVLDIVDAPGVRSSKSNWSIRMSSLPYRERHAKLLSDNIHEPFADEIIWKDLFHAASSKAGRDH